ncbi:2-hydroxy-6-oxonona-2,4-dienedioate hydrolase [Streptomyces sp. SAI-117]|jgi:2-hydroxy-6-oxonona-2,4-dienedioate hydrolase|uniref:alpha/beta fold hydrolase n=1 Tax=Streptomyces sp. SAI-117 TaxID=2940546 RepID=UPI002476D557|nr:alpha/beta hydrolase [Streptomyces sp. SAI-117]MDH6573659.1 2-hydroxy-6-oxonona-2,4-dienedioate hydrolase [Streptomyces sp. SAI-117]
MTTQTGSIPAPTYDSTKRIVRTPDYEIQINEAGEGHPVLLIHGTGPGATGWSNFAPNIGPLAQRFRVIAVTMPGWGESSRQNVESGFDQGEAVKQLMDALDIERAAIVGNSMGGGVGIIMTARWPERVSHLITMGSGVWGVNVLSPAGMTEGFKVLVETYQDPSPENFKRLVQVMCFDPTFATDELAEQRSQAALAHPDHLSDWLERAKVGLGQEAFMSAAQALHTSSVPALIIHGRDDRTVHWEISLRAMSMIQDSRMVMLNRCGHWAQLEHAAEFNRLVTEFVTNHH